MTVAASSSPIDVLIVGALPPPTGGVTVHCARIRAALSRLGLNVDVVNPRPGAASNEHELVGLAALRRLARVRRDRSICFLHFSGSSDLFRTARVVLLGRLIGRRRLVLVQHSGAYPQLLTSSSAVGFLHRRLVRASAAVLCLSGAIDRAVHHVAPRVMRIRTPSFVATETMQRLRTSRAAKRRPMILTSGYRTPTYRYQELIEVFSELRTAYPDLELHLYCYGETDDDYWPEIVQLIEAEPDVVVFHDVDEAGWLEALSQASVYVRNTSHDSYGVAVAESIHLGVPAVATDVCERAPGALVYRVGDVVRLTGLIAEVLVDSERPALDTPDAIDGYRSAIEAIGGVRIPARPV